MTTIQKPELENKANALIDEKLPSFIEGNTEFADFDDMQSTVSEFANQIMLDLGLDVPDTFQQIYWAQPLGETIYFGDYDIAYTEGKSKIVWRTQNFKEALLNHMGI